MGSAGQWRNVWAVALVLGLSGMAGIASGEDWPQFMGPRGDGTSAEKGLMRAWPEGGPKVLWTAKLSAGYGGAAIREGKVYLMDRVPQQKDVLRCLDLVTGKEEWTFSCDAPGRIDHEGSRCTPTVTDKHVFIIGPFGQLHCIDRTTHEVVWKKHLLNDYAGRKPNWAVAQSALPYKNLVIVAPQSNTVGMVALDQATGNEAWKSGPIGNMAYGSPMLVNVDGVDQAVIVNGKGAAGVSAADGQVLWEYAHRCNIPVPNVTRAGRRQALRHRRLQRRQRHHPDRERRLEVGRQGTGQNPPDGRPLPSGTALSGPHLHALQHQRAPDGMVCFDLSGKVAWQTKRAPYLCKGGSVLTADGLIYQMDGERGELHIVEPSAGGFKSLGKVKLLDGREIWGPLALADGKLVIRDQTQIKCVDVKP